MKLNSILPSHATPIAQSIASYQNSLIKDISLSLRLTYHQKSYSTQLVDWTDELVIFESPMQGLDYVILPADTLLNAAFMTKTTIFTTTFRILKKYRKGNSLYYMAQIIKPLVKRQKRDAYRLDVLLDVNYILLPQTETAENVSPVIQKGTCLNISTGGMCLACDKQLHANRQVELSFCFMNHDLKLTGEILFLGERTETELFTHRIRFTQMKSSDINLLNKLIFEKQRLQLKIQHT